MLIDGFWVLVKLLRNKVTFLNAYAFSELMVYSQSDSWISYTEYTSVKGNIFTPWEKLKFYLNMLVHNLYVGFSFYHSLGDSYL